MFFLISPFYKQCYISLIGFTSTKKRDLLGPCTPCTMAHTSLSPYREGEHMGAQHSHARTMRRVGGHAAQRMVLLAPARATRMAPSGPMAEVAAGFSRPMEPPAGSVGWQEGGTGGSS